MSSRRRPKCTLQLRHRVWYITFFDPRRGKQVQRTLKTSDSNQAEDYRQALEAILANPLLWNDPPKDAPQQVLEIWQAGGRSVRVDGRSTWVPLVTKTVEVRRPDNSTLVLKRPDSLTFMGGDIDFEGPVEALERVAELTAALEETRADLEAARVKIAAIQKDNENLRRTVDKQEADLERWRGKEAKRAKVSISQVVKEYMKWCRLEGGLRGLRASEKNAKIKQSVLDWWIEELCVGTLQEIDGREVERIKMEFAETPIRTKSTAKERTPRTVNARVAHLRALYNWARKRGYLSGDPLNCIGKMDETPVNTKRPLTESETRRLLKAAPVDRVLAYETALGTGFRLGELRALKVSSIRKGALYLSKYDPKNRKETLQPIAPGLEKKIRRAAQGKAADSPILDLPSIADDNLHADLQAAHVDDEKVGWGSFRKTYISRLVASGADPKTVQALARHSTATLTLEVYAHADNDRLRQVVEQMAS